MGINIQVRSSMININRDVCSVEGPRHQGTSGQGWERGRRADRRRPARPHGSRVTLARIGEAGPEAVIPLKGGAIPAMQDLQGRLRAIVPSG
jgi:hypothetical protein